MGGGHGGKYKSLFDKNSKIEKLSRQVSIPKNIERQIKRLSPEAKRGIEKALKALKEGDTRGLNDHPLSGNRSGQRSLDIKGTGKGRGAGRLIYQIIDDWKIIIIQILTNHNY